MRYIGLAALTLLCGCARLIVEVDVVEPRYAREAALEAGLSLEATDIAVAPHRRTDVFVDRAFATYRQFRDDCIDELVRDAAAITGAEGDAARALRVYVARLTESKDPLSGETAAINSEREAARQRLYLQDDAVLAAMTDNVRTGNTTELSAALRVALLNRRAVIAEIETKLRANIRGELSGGAECRSAATVIASAAGGQTGQQISRKAEAKVETAAQQITQIARQTTITGDGMLLTRNLEAFYITNAPEEVWARRYNRALGSGTFGSTSVAIVMNQTADFSVKGFVFDGRSTAQMVQKVGTQALSLIAGASGAPITLSRPSGTPTGSPTQFDAGHLIAQSRTTVDRAEAEQEAFDLALLRIADSVMGNWDGLTAVTESSAARTIVSGTLSAYRTSWSGTAQTNPQ
jgi:hypothetical protein